MYINEVMKKRGYSKCRVAVMASIPQNNFYQATNGKKSFFPAWRKRLSIALEVPEHELFPDYPSTKGE